MDRIGFVALGESTEKERVFDWLDGLRDPIDSDIARIDAGLRGKMKENLQEYLHGLSRNVALELLTEFMRERLSLDEGYTIEDIAEFLRWLKHELDYNV